MMAKQKVVKTEEETQVRAFKSFSKEELKRPANIGRVHKRLTSFCTFVKNACSPIQYTAFRVAEVNIRCAKRNEC